MLAALRSRPSLPLPHYDTVLRGTPHDRRCCPHCRFIHGSRAAAWSCAHPGGTLLLMALMLWGLLRAGLRLWGN